MPNREVWWLDELKGIDKSLRSLRIAGFGRGDFAYDALWRQRGVIFGKHGLRLPRLPKLILRLPGFSPGEILVWHDGETGFMLETRVKPGALPVYRHITDDVAITIFRGKLTHKAFEELSAPDTYYGE